MKGFSLIEVMIALFLTSVSMLNFMQQKIKVTNILQQTYCNDIALQQALSIVERLRVNVDTNYRLREISQWNKENNEMLPHGEGKINLTEKRGDITICWKKRLKKCLVITLLF